MSHPPRGSHNQEPLAAGRRIGSTSQNPKSKIQNRKAEAHATGDVVIAGVTGTGSLEVTVKLNPINQEFEGVRAWDIKMRKRTEHYRMLKNSGNRWEVDPTKPVSYADSPG